MLLLECDDNLLTIVKLVKQIMWYITIAVPIILIAIGTFDLLKAVTAAKEDEIKAAQKLLIKRLIYAVLIFLIVPIVSLVFGLFKSAGVQGDTTYNATWGEYWNVSGQCAGH